MSPLRRRWHPLAFLIGAQMCWLGLNAASSWSSRWYCFSISYCVGALCLWPAFRLFAEGRHPMLGAALSVLGGLGVLASLIALHPVGCLTGYMMMMSTISLIPEVNAGFFACLLIHRGWIALSPSLRGPWLTFRARFLRARRIYGH